VRLLGLAASRLVADEVQLGLFDQAERRSEDLLRSIDRLREKYGHRVLKTGLTFFDDYVSDEDWEPGKRTGLSSQIGLERKPGHHADGERT
jgi:hypothetical protein